MQFLKYLFIFFFIFFFRSPAVFNSILYVYIDLYIVCCILSNTDAMSICNVFLYVLYVCPEKSLLNCASSVVLGLRPPHCYICLCASSFEPAHITRYYMLTSRTHNHVKLVENVFNHNPSY